MTQPLQISVVIPAYNRASTLARCLLSISGQSLPPAEIIVVDDGSTDRTADVVRALNLPTVTYVHQANAGANAARNAGAALARHDWIAFQDADDIWLPHKLASLSDALLSDVLLALPSGERPLVAFSSFLTFDMASGTCTLKPASLINRSKTPLVIADPIGETGLLHENLISTQTLLLHRSVFTAVGGFDASLQRFQDWDLAIRLAEISPFLFVPEPLVVAEAMAVSLSRNYAAGIAARKRFLTKYKSLYDQYPQQRACARRAIALRQIVGFVKSKLW